MMTVLVLLLSLTSHLWCCDASRGVESNLFEPLSSNFGSLVIDRGFFAKIDSNTCDTQCLNSVDESPLGVLYLPVASHMIDDIDEYKNNIPNNIIQDSQIRINNEDFYSVFQLSGYESIFILGLTVDDSNINSIHSYISYVYNDATNNYTHIGASLNDKLLVDSNKFFGLQITGNKDITSDINDIMQLLGTESELIDKIINDYRDEDNNYQNLLQTMRLPFGNMVNGDYFNASFGLNPTKDAYFSVVYRMSKLGSVFDNVNIVPALVLRVSYKNISISDVNYDSFYDNITRNERFSSTNENELIVNWQEKKANFLNCYFVPTTLIGIDLDNDTNVGDPTSVPTQAPSKYYHYGTYGSCLCCQLNRRESVVRVCVGVLLVKFDR